MTITTAVRSFSVLVDSHRLANKIEIRWHSGEPLISSPKFYSEVIKKIRQVIPEMGADYIHIPKRMGASGSITNVLGLNLYFHDSAAAILQNGKVIAALEEERWFRDDKHTAIFPERSIKYCLEALGCNQLDIFHVAINMNPIRCLSNSSNLVDVICHPKRWNRKHWNNFIDRRRVCRQTNGQVLRTLIDLKLDRKFQYHFVAHHAHAASALFVFPYDEAVVLTIDANGEWATSTTSIGRGNKIQRLQTLGLPNSLGAVYASITEYLGFKRNNDEFKVMGLAAYGDPLRYRSAMRDLIYPADDGFFLINIVYFNYSDYKICPNNKLHELFDCPPRKPDTVIEEQHKDIAAALQERLEEIVIHIARNLQRRTGLKKICLAIGNFIVDKGI